MELRLVAQNRAIQATGLYNPGTVDQKLGHHAQPVLIFEQGSLSRRKLFRKHRKIPHSGVHGRRFTTGVLIDRSQLGHERIDVGDPDHDPDPAIGQTLGNLDLVEVARGVVVDRRPEQISKVANIALSSHFRRPVAQRRKLRLHLRRKVRPEAALDHDFLCNGLQINVRRIRVPHELLIVTKRNRANTSDRLHSRNTICGHYSTTTALTRFLGWSTS